MTSEGAEEDDEALKQKVEDEIDKEITDEVKESTVDYYLKTKDQVLLQLIGKPHSLQWPGWVDNNKRTKQDVWMMLGL